eukprot:2332267-Amphidinium_carterae.1
MQAATSRASQGVHSGCAHDTSSLVREASIAKTKAARGRRFLEAFCCRHVKEELPSCLSVNTIILRFFPSLYCNVLLSNRMPFGDILRQALLSTQRLPNLRLERYDACGALRHVRTHRYKSAAADTTHHPVADTFDS